MVPAVVDMPLSILVEDLNVVPFSRATNQENVHEALQCLIGPCAVGMGVQVSS